MKILIFLIAVIAAAGLAGAFYFRMVPDDPDRWHVDPLTAVKPRSPNAVLIRPEGGDDSAPVYDVPPKALAIALASVALAEPNTKRIAGAPDALWQTFVQRSALWAFPDYISIKVVPVEGGATYAAFSRARYGYSDLGVNAARMARWQVALEQRLAP
ncbi:DUF1499 domain-containing protein [Rhodovulum adriaticum]|uniref:Uncharacterized protein (DUF1499 family) n=1 Tax=Rhodovulum adriaticum TaxID=35804 RepID=A0A4R2NNI0_RHOAD|nr:DUF1499 domain-containing protein [Rhodovulum adriaticum]MBK1634508.1 hypothetical protein [Rhodovulum adriaticum]TCP23122.1 uncharacterized protein (DUF1499 family) [Rhodovulum adriaticum]